MDASSAPETHRRGGLVALFDHRPRLLTAISVAYFACLGLALRASIALLLQDVTFGLTTTEPGQRGGFYRGCHMKSDAAGYFVQNILGCILMAVVARHKKSMNEHLAVGLASGLCGSLTTWATWMGEEAVTIMNGYLFEAFVSLLSTLCVCLCAYKFGHFIAGCGMGDEPRCFDDLCGLRALGRLCCGRGEGGARKAEDESSDKGADAESGGAEGAPGAAASGEAEDGAVDAMDWGLALDESAEEDARREPAGQRQTQLSLAMELFIVFLAGALILLYVGLCAGLGYDAGLLDLAYAPAGALLRWYLSLHNASYQEACFGIPVFTLAANTLGCVCNAFPAVLAGRVQDHVGHVAITAISTGFAGCLSTVSTLVGELRSDAIGRLRVRVAYFLISFGLAMAAELPILSAHC